MKDSIVNENEDELCEFVDKIRKSNLNTKSASLKIILNSTSIPEHGKEIGFSVITNTTTDFLSYKEKWSQW